MDVAAKRAILRLSVRLPGQEHFQFFRHGPGKNALTGSRIQERVELATLNHHPNHYPRMLAWQARVIVQVLLAADNEVARKHSRTLKLRLMVNEWLLGQPCLTGLLLRIAQAGSMAPETPVSHHQPLSGVFMRVLHQPFHIRLAINPLTWR